MANEVWIYGALLILGFIFGYTIGFGKYANKVLEVLDILKFSKIISNQDYEEFKNKFITKKDDLKGLKSMIKRKMKKEGKEDVLISEEN